MFVVVFLSSVFVCFVLHGSVCCCCCCVLFVAFVVVLSVVVFVVSFCFICFNVSVCYYLLYCLCFGVLCCFVGGSVFFRRILWRSFSAMSCLFCLVICYSYYYYHCMFLFFSYVVVQCCMFCFKC